MMSRMDIAGFVFILELIGTAAFAVSGVMVARDRKMDLFGACLLGCTTACGGGVIRDLLLGVIPPMLFRSPVYIITAFAASLVTFLIFYFTVPPHPNAAADRLLNSADSLGLAAFVVVGYQGAVNAGFSSNGFLCIFVGVLTGIGGGILRDILAGQMPLIMSKRVYGVAAIAGAVCYWLLLIAFRGATLIPSLISIAVTALIRFLAIHYRWNLPKLK